MISVGMTNTMEITVEPQMTAKALKSGALDVFASPIMIAFMENCAMDCVSPHLEPGMTTVGTAVDVSHLAPTPVGMKVTFQCRLVEIDRRRLVFEVTATDERELIGKGIHQRFIVSGEKFYEKCAEKL